MPKPVTKDLKAFEETLLRTRSIKSAALAAGYSKGVASQGLAKLPKAALKIVTKRARKLMQLSDEFNAASQERLVRGGLIGSVLGTAPLDKNQVRAAELLGKDKRVSMFTADVYVGVQVNVAALSALESDPDVVRTPVITRVDEQLDGNTP